MRIFSVLFVRFSRISFCLPLRVSYMFQSKMTSSKYICGNNKIIEHGSEGMKCDAKRKPARYLVQIQFFFLQRAKFTGLFWRFSGYIAVRCQDIVTMYLNV